MSSKPATIDEYILGFPKDIQLLLKQIRETVMNAAPTAKETIRYGMPAFRINKEHIYMAAYKKHIGMYPMYGLDELEAEINIWRGKNTKDAIHFPYGQPIPFNLIKKIIKHKISSI